MTRRQFFVALVVLFVGGVIGGAFNTWLMPGGRAWAQGSAATVKEVRAEGFALVDEAQNERASLCLGDGEPRLAFFDASGRTRAELALISGGLPRLMLYDMAERPRLTVAVSAEGAMIGLHDAAGQVRVGVDENGLGLYDSAGAVRAAFYSFDDSGPMLMLNNSASKPLIVLSEMNSSVALLLRDVLDNDRMAIALDNGRPLVRLSDAANRVRAELVLSDDGNPALALMDPARPRMAFGLMEGDPMLELYNATGQVQWHAP